MEFQKKRTTHCGGLIKSFFGRDWPPNFGGIMILNLKLYGIVYELPVSSILTSHLIRGHLRIPSLWVGTSRRFELELSSSSSSDFLSHWTDSTHDDPSRLFVLMGPKLYFYFYDILPEWRRSFFRWPGGGLHPGWRSWRGFCGFMEGAWWSVHLYSFSSM